MIKLLKYLLGYKELGEIKYDEEEMSWYSHGERMKVDYPLEKLNASFYNGKAEDQIGVNNNEQLAKYVEANAPQYELAGTITYREVSDDYEALEITAWIASESGQDLLEQIIAPQSIRDGGLRRSMVGSVDKTTRRTNDGSGVYKKAGNY